MLTLDLKKSNNQDVIQGKLILNISTNVNAPIRNGNNTIASSSRSPIARDSSNQSIATSSSSRPTSSQAQPQLSALLPPPHSARNPGPSSEETRINNDLPEG